MTKFLTALSFFVQHSLAGLAVVVSFGLGVLWPLYYYTVHLDGQFMTSERGFFSFMVTVLPAMLCALVVWTIVRAYTKGAPRKHD